MKKKIKFSGELKPSVSISFKLKHLSSKNKQLSIKSSALMLNNNTYVVSGIRSHGTTMGSRICLRNVRQFHQQQTV